MDVAKLYEELVDLKKRLKTIEDMNGITHFCDLRDEEKERTILDHLTKNPDVSEVALSQETGIDPGDLKCYTTSLLYRDMIRVLAVESEVREGYAVTIVQRLGITQKGKDYLAEISI
ncbi:MAG: hypothetical protein JSV43_00340 [Methanobacteriota archaeon]|nr:MAG: hypothetical protein JSV43_00340 [Euryarchaeota archaeon]